MSVQSTGLPAGETGNRQVTAPLRASVCLSVKWKLNQVPRGPTSHPGPHLCSGDLPAERGAGIDSHSTLRPPYPSATVRDHPQGAPPKGVPTGQAGDLSPQALRQAGPGAERKEGGRLPSW